MVIMLQHFSPRPMLNYIPVIKGYKFLLKSNKVWVRVREKWCHKWWHTERHNMAAAPMLLQPTAFNDLKSDWWMKHPKKVFSLFEVGGGLPHVDSSSNWWVFRRFYFGCCWLKLWTCFFFVFFLHAFFTVGPPGSVS